MSRKPESECLAWVRKDFTIAQNRAPSSRSMASGVRGGMVERSEDVSELCWETSCFAGNMQQRGMVAPKVTPPRIHWAYTCFLRRMELTHRARKEKAIWPALSL